MANFSLLTTLSLNAAGFTKGIDKVSKQTQSFKKGTEQASKSIASSFQNLGGVLGGAVNTQLGTLGQSITGGISAFKAMIPAINGVKMALISSGIGAIVVAIGVAFGAIMNYLTGTAEGAQKLNVILGYLKGTFNALLSRVNAFGSGLVSLLSGDFEGFKNSMKEAFAGGIMDEIKADAKEFVGFAEEENRLWKENLRIKTEGSRLEAEIAGYATEAKNRGRTNYENEAAYIKLKEKDAELDEMKQKYLYDEWQLQINKNKAKGESVSKSDLEAAAEKESAYWAEKRADNEEQAKYNKIEYRIESEKSAQISEIENEKIKSRLQIYDELNNIIIKSNQNTEELIEDLEGIDDIKIDAKPNDATDLNAWNEEWLNFYKTTEKGQSESIEAQKSKLLEYYNLGLISQKEYESQLEKFDTSKLEGFFSKFGEGIKKGFDVAFQSLALWDSILELQEQQELERAGNNAAMKEEIEKKYAKKRKKLLMAQAIAQGAVAVIGALTTQPIWVGLVMAALTAAMVGVQIAKINSAGFAQGGIVAGTSFAGDKVTAKVNSGEMILNGRQQANLFKLANSPGGTGGEVTFRIEGTQLVGVLSNYSRQTQRTR